MKPVLVVVVASLWACSDAPHTPTPPSAPEEAPTPAAVAAPEVPEERILSAKEFELLQDDLEDLRAGVRPFSDESVGLCTKAGKTCGAYLGRAPEPLGAGDYMLWAELRVPRLGPEEGWPVTLDTSCSIETAGGSRTNDNSRTYTVNYAGEERGYRLRMREFSSPGKGGATRCTWSLRSALEEDRVVAEGAWTLPAEGA